MNFVLNYETNGLVKINDILDLKQELDDIFHKDIFRTFFVLDLYQLVSQEHFPVVQDVVNEVRNLNIFFYKAAILGLSGHGTFV